MSENVHFRSTTRHMLRESQNYVNQTLMGGLSGFESPIGLDRRDPINPRKSGDIGFVHSSGNTHDRLHERLPIALPVLPESGYVENA